MSMCTPSCTQKTCNACSVSVVSKHFRGVPHSVVIFSLSLYYFPLKIKPMINSKNNMFYLCDLQNFFGPEFVKMTVEPFISLDLPRSILVSIRPLLSLLENKLTGSLKASINVTILLFNKYRLFFPMVEQEGEEWGPPEESEHNAPEWAETWAHLWHQDHMQRCLWHGGGSHWLSRASFVCSGYPQR